jgi:septal ring factor EnvC (AmiA/AmiB activator)
MGEQSLTPGEQRILALMEQGQQRLDQRLDRMDQRLQSLEDGQKRTEQRLQSLEDGQKRTEQRLQSLEDGQKRTEQQIKELALKVDQEAVDSKLRDRKLASDLERLREEGQNQKVWLVGRIERSQKEMLEAMHQEMNSLRADFSARFDQHNTRLRAVEHTLERHEEHMREHGQAIRGLQQEMQKLTAAVERLVQAPHLATAPSRPAQ